MKAIIQRDYGSSDVLELREIDTPVSGNDDVLVRVRAAALHAGDVFCMRGVPWVARMSIGLPRPRNYVPGYDVAGIVETVGTNVTGLQPGDEVFGACTGACAEYVSTSGEQLAPKPASLTFEQAAAVPTSAVAALRGLRDAGRAQPGQQVLINGASGGVGTFAVQIAKALGAKVTGVCSTTNTDLVRSIGADHVIDYTREDFTQGTRRYDLILDNVANHSLADCRRALTPTGTHLPNSGNAGMGFILKAFVLSAFVRRQGSPFLAVPRSEDLIQLKEFIEAGNVTPVIDRTYALSETPEAMGYVGEGRARGKVVIAV